MYCKTYKASLSLLLVKVSVNIEPGPSLGLSLYSSCLIFFNWGFRWIWVSGRDSFWCAYIWKGRFFALCCTETASAASQDSWNGNNKEGLQSLGIDAWIEQDGANTNTEEVQWNPSSQELDWGWLLPKWLRLLVFFWSLFLIQCHAEPFRKWNWTCHRDWKGFEPFSCCSGLREIKWKCRRFGKWQLSLAAGDLGRGQNPWQLAAIMPATKWRLLLQCATRVGLFSPLLLPATIFLPVRGAAPAGVKLCFIRSSAQSHSWKTSRAGWRWQLPREALEWNWNRGKTREKMTL